MAQAEIKRTLNLFDTVMLVSGSMIGSGIFIVTADMVRVLGSPLLVLFCWILSGVISLFAALSYGELAAMMPEAGGQFIYIRRAFGNLSAFVYGWTVFAVIQTGVIAAVAVAFAKYVGVFIPFFSADNVLLNVGGITLSAAQLLAVASIFFLSYLNSRGINNGKIIQRLFTSTKLIALAALIIVGLIYGASGSHWQTNIQLPFKNLTLPDSQSTGLSAILGALGVALIGSLFSSDAWNNVTFIAGEVKDPRKNIPLGLLIGVLLVTILYILANVAYFMLLPAWGDVNALTVDGRGIAFAENDRVGSAALFPVFGEVSAAVMALLIIVSTFGCNNGLILQGARLFHSMSEQGLFFKSLQHLNKNGVPAKALWAQAIWASVLCLSGSYGQLLDYCTFASLVFYIVTIIGLFYLRHKEPDTPRPYRALGYPIIPALYILFASAICIDLLIFKTQNTLLGIVRICYPYFLPESQVQVKWLSLAADSSQENKTQHNISETAISSGEIRFHNFNPNTASLEALVAAGFPKKTAGTFVKFRAKGFVVREKKDLLKVYGFTSDLFARLENYVVLDAVNKPGAFETKPTKTIVKIELNSADTLQLQSLPGIGPALSKRIVKYRTLLGGFHTQAQLKEVYGISEEVIEHISPLLKVDTLLIQPLYPNLADFKVLAKHPYIGYEFSKKICNQREKQSLNAAQIQVLLGNEALFVRLRPYLAFAK
eukprot:gene4010-5737_t